MSAPSAPAPSNPSGCPDLNVSTGDAKTAASSAPASSNSSRCPDFSVSTGAAKTAAPSFDAFVKTIAILRSPEGCPWDRQQTHASISKNMIEEAYEATAAIESGDPEHLKEELGDVLLQVVLQSQIAADAGEFTIEDVCATVNEKMIRRHPHIFGDATAETPEEVAAIWDQVKLQETEHPSGSPNPSTSAVATAEAAGGPSTSAVATAEAKRDQTGASADVPSLLSSVPTGMPALMQAQKISRKAVSAGFEWPSIDDVWAKVYEEINELKEASTEEAPLEFGDVLFALVNVGRKMGIDAESALRASCNKFRNRWSFMEGAAWAQGRQLQELTVDELQELWQSAKSRESHGSAAG